MSKQNKDFPLDCYYEVNDIWPLTSLVFFTTGIFVCSTQNVCHLSATSHLCGDDVSLTLASICMCRINTDLARSAVFRWSHAVELLECHLGHTSSHWALALASSHAAQSVHQIDSVALLLCRDTGISYHYSQQQCSMLNWHDIEGIEKGT